MRDRIRWGIAGTGIIANSFASDLRFAGNATLAAVSSRSAEKAHAFAAHYGGIRSYHDIQALVEAPDIDAIYIASPNAVHREHAVLALAAGKAVLIDGILPGQEFLDRQCVARAGLFQRQQATAHGGDHLSLAADDPAFR